MSGMDAAELPYVLEQEGVKYMRGCVYYMSKKGKKIPLDFIYEDENEDLIFTDYDRYQKMRAEELEDEIYG